MDFYRNLYDKKLFVQSTFINLSYYYYHHGYLLQYKDRSYINFEQIPKYKIDNSLLKRTNLLIEFYKQKVDDVINSQAYTDDYNLIFIYCPKNRKK